MLDLERFRFETFLRLKQYGIESSADFPASTKGGINFISLNEVIAELEAAGASQAGGKNTAIQSYGSKGTNRENLFSILSQLARTSRSMAYEFAGIDDKFRLPRNVNDQELLAIARSSLTKAASHEQDFIAYEMPRLFMAELQEAVTAFENSLDETNSAVGTRVTATANMGEIVRRGMIIRRVLDGIIKNKYRDDAGKLAAWATASHIERPAKKKEEKPPNPS
jgi:hypothetical protein